MPTRPKGVVSVSAADIARDEAMKLLDADSTERRMVTRVESKPRSDVVSVTPYADQTINPNSTRPGGK